MNITQVAIEKKQVTIVFLLVILVAGFQTYQKMPRAEDPGFVIRAAQVTTFFPGASPERVEQLVTDKLEKIIQEIPEIDYIDSESKTGMSVITVNIKESYKHMRPIWDNLRRKVEDAEPDLPQDVIGPFVNDEFGDVFGIILALTGEGYTYAELKEIADDIRSELLLIEDVAKVDIHGIQEERVFVEYNNARLAELGLSPLQLQQILEQRNIIIPGGEIFTEDEQIALEPTGNFDSVADLEKTIIKLPARNEVFYLKDLVHIYRGYIDPPTSMVRYMGKPALALAINLRKGGNILRLGDIIKKRIKRFRSAYPIGVEFAPVAFQPIHVQKKVNDFVGSLLQAVGIVFIIMLIFLGMRTGLVVASLIPMAMITSILIMPFFNVGLDQMSLAALIIALGMLVDNAIVMSESIMVQMADGTPPVKAAIDSANELRIPLLTSSLTTAAAFLPIYLAESTVGEYTAAIFIVVTITLLGSWILSLSMTPLLCVKYLKVETKSGKTEFNTRFYRVYRGFLLMLLRHPLLSMSLTIGIFAISIYGFKYVPKIFFPPNDKPVFFAELILPIGTPLSKTQKIVSEIERFIEKELLGSTTNNKEGVIDWASFIGRGAPRYVLAYTPEPPSPEYAYLLINATSMAIIHN